MKKNPSFVHFLHPNTPLTDVGKQRSFTRTPPYAGGCSSVLTSVGTAWGEAGEWAVMSKLGYSWAVVVGSTSLLLPLSFALQGAEL